MCLPRKRPSPRPSLAAALLALSAACHAAGGAGEAPAAAVEPDPTVPARFQALAGALEDGDDELARAVLDGLRARGLTAREEERAASAERVLRGRELVRALELSLTSEPVADTEGRFRLVLVARASGAQALRLRLPPCDLKRSRASMDPRGIEGLEFESKGTSALADLRLAPGVEQRIELLTYELPLGRALGVRERWRVEARSGEIECGGGTFPAARVKIAACERERLAPALDPEPVAPGALAERLAASESTPPRALLELALRIASTERETALRALAPVVAELARTTPERVAAAEPALRWLTQNRDIGPDAAGWARYLAARASGGSDPDRARGNERLDLPAPPRTGGAR
jgi:hypothetical protein